MTIIHAVPEARIAAESGHFVDCAAAMNAATVVMRDKTPLTYTLIRSRLGEAARVTVANTLRTIAASESSLAGEVSDAHSLMLGSGMEIDIDERQAQIDQIAAVGGWSSELRDGIKQIGKRLVSPAQQAGYGTMSAAQCQAIWTAEQIRLRRQRWDAAAAAVRSQIETGGVSTDSQIVAAAQSALTEV